MPSTVRRRFRTSAVAATAVVLGFGGSVTLSASAAYAAAAPRPVQSGSSTTTGSPPGNPASTRLVPTTGNVPNFPSGTRKLAALAGKTRLKVDIVLAPRDPVALQTFISDVNTPGSPDFRHYLRPGQFGPMFGASQATISAVQQWLSDRGLGSSTVSSDGLIVSVSDSASRFGNAFKVGLRQFRLPTGRIVHGPTSEPSVPIGLKPDLRGIVGLDNFAQLQSHATPPAGSSDASAGTSSASQNGSVHADAKASSWPPSVCAGPSSAGGATVSQLEGSYSFGSTYGAGNFGQGVTVGIYELEEYFQSDIQNFESCYGFGSGSNPPVNLPSGPVDVDGGPGCANQPAQPCPGGGEAALDIEMVLGMAPEAKVTVYDGPDGGTGPIDTYQVMVNDDPKVITTSWGLCEPLLGTGVIDAEAEIFSQAETQGETIFAASGDSGSEDCYYPAGDPPDYDTSLQVDDPASQPYVTAVGGTSLTKLGSPATPLTESVWNSGGGATGGGVSHVWTMPSWQQGPGVENSFTSSSPCGQSASGKGAGSFSCREVPDVVSAADPSAGGFGIYLSVWDQQEGEYIGGWHLIGGTSQAAPLWAAIAALADEGQTTPVGDIHPALYRSACLPLAVPSSPSPFNDITSGENDLVGVNGGDYSATPGYDLASGLGSPIVSSLLPDLRTPPADNCPSASGVAPDSDKMIGGGTATISGTNLAGVTQVFFGGAAASIVSTNSTSVVVDIPPSPTGGPTTTDVVMNLPSINDSLGNDDSLPFTYYGPAVSSVSPPAGPLQGGTTITVNGSGFVNNVTPGSTVVSLVGSQTLAATNVDVVSNTEITATLPQASVAGPYNVEVTDSDGTSQVTAGDVYNFAPVPVVNGVSPSSGTARGYTSVMVTGSGFTSANAVWFGGLPASFTVLNDNTIVATSPDPSDPSTVNVVVQTFSQGSLTSATTVADLFTYVAPPKAYWMVASDGGIFAFGVPFKGSEGGKPLNAPIVGMAPTPSGQGYWEVASDGGIFTFGDAGFHGSEGGKPLNAPIVGMAATPDGKGYWEVASDGGIFTFGDAGFHGSEGGKPLNKPIVGMAPAPNGLGYWLVASDGGIFAFNVPFYGSMGGKPLNKPIVGIAVPYGGGGYWEVASDGGIFAFRVPFDGSMGGKPLNKPIVAMATP